MGSRWFPVASPETPVIDRFDGEHWFLSNFFPSPITYEGIAYRTIEHAYQAAKTFDQELRRAFAKLKSPAAAKRFGRQVELRSDWDGVKFKVMRELVRLKFAEDTGLAVRLVNTYPAYLIEGNTWGDTYWGACEGRGLNNLGYLLMEQRGLLMRERTA